MVKKMTTYKGYNIYQEDKKRPYVVGLGGTFMYEGNTLEACILWLNWYLSQSFTNKVPPIFTNEITN